MYTTPLTQRPVGLCATKNPNDVSNLGRKLTLVWVKGVVAKSLGYLLKLIVLATMPPDVVRKLADVLSPVAKRITDQLVKICFVTVVHARPSFLSKR
jgi:hypothetical protein